MSNFLNSHLNHGQWDRPFCSYWVRGLNIQGFNDSGIRWFEVSDDDGVILYEAFNQEQAERFCREYDESHFL